MNLYGYWSKPFVETVRANLLYFTPFFRPLGGLIYWGLYSVFGLNPLPFRIFCFALLLLNIFLLYKLAVAITGSKETGLLTALLGSHHAGYADLYFNSGTIYDLLVFFFFTLTMYLYVAKHRAIYVVLAFLCAINAKEMAVTLPVVLLLYELIFNRPILTFSGLKSWFLDRVWIVFLLGLLLLLYIYGKLGSGNLSGNPAFALNLSVPYYLTNSGHYMDVLLFQPLGWTTAKFLALFIFSMFALAAVLRSRVLFFCCLFFLLTPLPIIFIAFRGSLYLLYIPMIGLTLFVAAVIVRLRELASGSPALTFATVFLVLFWVHDRHRPIGNEVPAFRSTFNQLSALHLQPKPGARILMLEDPFDTDEWAPVFIGRILYNDKDLVVDRIKMMNQKPTAAEIQAYDYVLAYESGQLRLAEK